MPNDDHRSDATVSHLRHRGYSKDLIISPGGERHEVKKSHIYSCSSNAAVLFVMVLHRNGVLTDGTFIT